MNTKVVSSAEPILNFCSKPPNKSSKKPFPGNISSISFSSQVSKSIISIGKSPGSGRARPGGRIQAFYAPPAVETRESLYEVLGIVDTGSSFSDIKKAYKKMARKYHPDVSPPERVDEYTRRFIMVHEAYETLSNPQSRALYDRDLEFGFSAGKSQQFHHQKMEETGEWKMRWQAQLDELSRRGSNGRMSWGAKMRSQR